MKLVFNHSKEVELFAEMGLLEHLTDVEVSCHICDLTIHNQCGDCDFVIANLVRSKKLLVGKLSGLEMSEVAESVAPAENLNITDCAVCYYAKKIGGVVISSEVVVQRFAQKIGVQCKSAAGLLVEFFNQQTG